MSKKVVLYTRVSTNKEEQKKSIANQEERYIDYCNSRGYDLINIYADEGLTGTNARRIKFKEMLLDAGLDYERNDLGTDIFRVSKRKPKFDYILVKDATRFSRSTEIGISVVGLLRRNGVYVIFENSGFTTDAEDWDFRTGLLFTIAQTESSNMSKRIKFSKRHNAEKGKYAPARVPYGYTRNEKNEIVIHKEQAETVKYVFERYLDVGGSIISQELNIKGVLSQTGKLWTDDKVTRIIHNRIYTGTAIVGKSYKQNVTDTQRSKNSVDQYIEIPNAVEPIITIEQYEEANLIREKRVNKNKKVGRKPARNDIYNEKLFCSNCGSRFVRHQGFGGKTNYICQNRRKGLGCRVRGISIQNLNNSLAEVDLKYLSNAMGDSFYYKELLNLLANQKLKLANTKLDIRKQIDVLEDEIETISDKFAFLKDTDKMHARLVKKVEDRENQITELNQQFGKLNIESIEYILDRVEEKKMMIELLSTSKSIIVEDKLKLLHRIEIGDYELGFRFAIPSFEEEVDLYNKLFPMSPINLAIPFKPFTASFRRNHKSAREYWEELNGKS
ncbi:recombinase family protein [Planococcus sp. S3-L1]|uniref:recombinase family protein n=1 Tax=Planococcus sp. S3-L1 TaxID=3046200 RepID=UPI0024BA7965|nr:recombinase family protein [Planococcus sp. S3-L1]MDJ0332286.1 recombinase family protein [Planococcus sp. S3-L1]